MLVKIEILNNNFCYKYQKKSVLNLCGLCDSGSQKFLGTIELILKHMHGKIGSYFFGNSWKTNEYTVYYILN